MQAYADFGAALDAGDALRETSAFPVAAVGGEVENDMYAALVSKEHAVLDLVRRVDDTKREEAIRSTDHIAPLATAFVSGVSGFLARLVHYISQGSYKEVVGLVTSPDGMVYAGVMIATLSLVFAML